MRCSGRPEEGVDRTIPALVLKMVSQPLHYGTLAVIRSLGRIGVPVYSSHERTAAPAARSRYLSSDAIGVLPPSDPDFCIAQLKAFQNRIGGAAVIVPVDDNGALFLAEHAAALRPYFILPHQRPDLPRIVASKANNPELCAMAGAATPGTFVLHAADELSQVGANVRYPAVVKIAQPWLLPAGLRPAIYARSVEDVREYRSQLQANPGADLVVQEFIPHEEAEDWFYHGYHEEGGEPVVGFTGRKLRSYPPFLGATSYAVSLVNEDVLAIAQAMLRKLGYAGIVELEFLFDKRDGQYKFVDFNPRLGTQFQLLRNEARIDVVRAQHLHLTGRRVPVARQVEDMAFISEFMDLTAFLAYWREGEITPAAWLGQFLGADEHAWFAPDDIGPLLAAAGQWSMRVPKRLARVVAAALQARAQRVTGSSYALARNRPEAGR